MNTIQSKKKGQVEAGHGTFGTAAAKPEGGRPNVLLIITDDQGWGGMSSHGNPDLQTPVLDQLGDQGARFERYYVSPVSAPTRASLLTGRYHPRTGIIGIRPGLDTIRRDEVTIAEVLKSAGYATGCFGKWHNGTHYPYTPPGRGFDEFLGFCAGHWSNYFDTQLEHNCDMVQTEGFITDVLTDGAIEFIQQNHNGPFFCFVPYNAPHVPLQVPDHYFDKYKALGLDDYTACSYGMTENVDDNVGRLLGTLEALGVADNTIVMFTSDHGPDSARFNGGMRGFKKSMHEGGVRVPLLVRWPKGIKPGTKVDGIAADIDLLPTIIELTGIAPPQTHPLDGCSLAPLLQEQSVEWPDRMIFTYSSRSGIEKMTPCAVRNNSHRLVNVGDGYELYDMVADPAQEQNLAATEPEKLAELSAAYESWFEDVTKNATGRMPIPVGYDEAPRVTLPVTQAKRSDGLRFCGKAGGWNHDYLVNWSSTDEVVSWQIENVRPGKFEVSLLYTCPQKDIGASICIGIGDLLLDATIATAYDPEPLPSPDRVKRDLIYEKVWKPMVIDTIPLAAGMASVSVRATAIPGDQAMEFRGLLLRRVD